MYMHCYLREAMNQSTPYAIFNAQGYQWSEYIKAFWQHRHFIGVLVERNLRQRFLAGVWGWVWAFAQPLATFLVYTFFVGYVFQIQLQYPIGYGLYVLSGLLFWNLFVGVFADCQAALSSNVMMAKYTLPLKSYLFVASAAVKLIEQIPFILLLLIWTSWFAQLNFTMVLALLSFSLLSILLGLSLGVLFALKSLKNQSLSRHVSAFIHFGIWLVPVFYSLETFPNIIASFVAYNPLASFIMAYRAIAFNGHLPINALVFGSVTTILLFIFAIASMKHSEKNIAQYL